MKYSEILRLYEKKDHIIKKTHMTDEQKAEVIEFFTKHREQENQISGDEWNKPESLTYERFKQVIDAFNNRNTKSRANKIANKVGIAGLTEGKDYLDFGEFVDESIGTFRAYVPLSWLGAKTIAGPTVKPVNGKNSASWCIGWSESDRHWNEYFFKYRDAFLIICGEDVPTKKVCFEIDKFYDGSDYSNEETKSLINNEELQNVLKVWNYYDNANSFCSFCYSTSGGSLDSLIKVLLSLITKAKISSDEKRIDIIKEFEKPRVTLRSTYIDQITSERNTEKYNKYLNAGIKFLEYLDYVLITDITKKMTIRFFVSSCKNDDYSDFVGSTVDWYNRNAEKSLIDCYVLDFINPQYLLQDTAININTHNTQYYYLCDIGGIPGDSETKFSSTIERIDSSWAKGNTLYKKYLKIRGVEETPIGKRNAVADFNEFEILKVKDLIAFLGEEVITKNSLDTNFRVTFAPINIEATEISDIVSITSSKLLWWRGGDDTELYQNFFNVLKNYISDLDTITLLFKSLCLLDFKNLSWTYDKSNVNRCHAYFNIPNAWFESNNFNFKNSTSDKRNSLSTVAKNSQELISGIATLCAVKE